MHKIVPVQVPTVGLLDSISINVLPFNLFPSTISLYYRISNDYGKSLDGNLTLPEEVVAVWAEDDTVVLNFVLAELGLQLAPVEPEVPAA